MKQESSPHTDAAQCATKEEPKLTPMLEQYKSIKKEAQDALLFFRMGDFYELFFEDALLASQELQIALTARNHKGVRKIPMCGVPWHSVDSYLTTLLKKGYSIAICDQVSEPKEGTALVERAITRVLTPGTLTEEGVLLAKEYNFLGALLYDDKKAIGALAWVDISTGKLAGLSEIPLETLTSWVAKLDIKELLVPDTFDKNLIASLDQRISVVQLPVQGYFSYRYAKDLLLKTLAIPNLTTIDLEEDTSLVSCLGALLRYLHTTQKSTINVLNNFEKLSLNETVFIDERTERNLELFKPLYSALHKKEENTTLFHTVDATCTPLGGRFLQEKLKNPLISLEKLRLIQNTVTAFCMDVTKLTAIRTALTKIADLERIINRIVLQRAYPRDLIALRESLGALPTIHTVLQEIHTLYNDAQNAFDGSTLLYTYIQQFDTLGDLHTLLQEAIQDQPPSLFTQDGVIKHSYNPTLQRLISLSEESSTLLENYVLQEQKNTGIAKIKLGYTKILGYFLEITKNSTSNIPSHFIRKQSLVNAERYTTEELLSLEQGMFLAKEERKKVEQEIIQDIITHIGVLRPRISFMAQMIAAIDFIQCGATIATKCNWCKPHLCLEPILHIEGGRHPVVEAIQGAQSFVPNDLSLHHDATMLLVTGPNMGGKSTFLRQVALITILAQIGFYVPAKKATIGLVDKVFCRVGASDNLARGESTFMVEMLETARILRQATAQSLVILDEIGRGTATFDGLALAWAITEALAHYSMRSRTIFATHYHEITRLAKEIPTIATAYFDVKEHNDTVIFLHTLKQGVANKSYGIEVAKLAGIPSHVVQRAQQLLQTFEGQHKEKNTALPLFAMHSDTASTPLTQKLEHLKALDINTLTPLQSMEFLLALQKLL